MESGAEAEKNKAPEGGETKSKRQMKTAAQLEVLEKTYAAEAYPLEATRAELSVKLGLSDRQLQMWFCHRRLKDRKPTPGKPHRKDSPAVESKSAANADQLEAGNEHSSFGHELDPRRGAARSSMAVQRVGRYKEPSPPVTAEHRAIAVVEAQLGELLREDGPILGMEFDPLPPGAFGTPIVTSNHHKASGQAFEPNLHERADVKLIKDFVRPIREYQFLPEQPSSRIDHSPSHHSGVPLDASVVRASSYSGGHPFSQRDENSPFGYGYSTQIPNLNLSTHHQPRLGNVFSPSSGEHDSAHRKNYMETAVHGNFDAHPIQNVENPFVLPERKVGNDDEVVRMERKRKSEEARIAREVEAHEKKMRKELEKQDILRRKREEQVKKEMERQDRERRKEEERLLRERQREEERYLKEQRREMLRREKFLIKESIRAEKMRQKEEIRRVKEAARLKAANERAIARKMAKETMELIEDERLELMELAASSKGLPSMIALDFETLQNLDAYRDKLIAFPPTSVKLKKPFKIQPWNGSEDNVGSLLMVWRFLITFADVLGIWPFTLDEFTQAFHDHDPRLMGEVHIVLLRTIIRDIEDVAKALSMGAGANQNAAANPGGGHPHIVEGAYAWGFNIRSWKHHLNALTWPEILRQLALSSGFGPQLKKQYIEQLSPHEDNEINKSEDVIFSLRNGLAAENAFAKMQERGISNPRRSRHRLTPGTVKFAAFHVLSLEAEKGLTILEVAEKIQKSGLRDLSTSKTPEASIAAALSRDTKLFERVAPSTYCVRALYRKDVDDAEAILAEARERIRMFKSGSTEIEDIDDAERDEDSESDVGDDPEVDDLEADLDPKKEALVAAPLTENPINLEPISENGNLSAEVVKIEPRPSLTHSHSEDIKEKKKGSTLVDQSMEEGGANVEKACIDREDPSYDEGQVGEQWVQGLIEGEYSDLSVEERLSALVALISVATEGNTIRVALEERLEAASGLKKQMWAEAQLDKRRIKEEFVIKTNYLSTKSDDKKSPLLVAERNNDDRIMSHESVSLAQNDQCYSNNIGVNLQMQEPPSGLEDIQSLQQGYAVDRERLRAQLKAYVGYKAEELYVYRSLPLGQDRRRNRYWRFTASASQSDPGCGRIFVELHEGKWRLIDSEEGLDSLIKSLDVRGVRESHLHFMLQKIKTSFKEAVRRNRVHVVTQTTSEAEESHRPSSSVTGFDSDSDTAEVSTTFKIELGGNKTERLSVLKRYMDLEKWMWENALDVDMLSAFKYGVKKRKALVGICSSCGEVYLTTAAYCPGCSQPCSSDTSGLCVAEQVAWLRDHFRGCPDSVPSLLRIRLLKLIFALVEDSLPCEGLRAIWTENMRKLWGLKLFSSKSPEELLQVLTTLESALKRDYLSSNFETTSELLGIQEQHEAMIVDDPPTVCGPVAVLPWIPRTTAAVALRLLELDGFIAYTPTQKIDLQKDRDFIVSEANNMQRNRQDNVAATETPSRALYTQEEKWTEPGLVISSSGRGRPRGRGRARARGGKSGRKAKAGARSVSRRRAAEKPNGEVVERSSVRGGGKRGRRSNRSRSRPTKGTLGISNDGGCRDEGFSVIPTMQDQDEWIETPELHGDDASSSGRSLQYNYDDDVAAAEAIAEDEFEGGSSSKLVGRGEFSLHSDEEELGEDEDEDGEEHEGNMNVDVDDDDDDEYMNEEESYEPDKDGGKMFTYEDPDLTSSSSSGFSH